jgi:anti-sigma-K factor RskA
MTQTNKAQTDKDFLTRLADRGEQVVGRITDLPGAKQLIDTTGALAKRVDTMQRQLRSLDPLQKRVTAIERRLDKLEGKGTTRKRTTTRKTTAAKPTSTSTTPKSTGSKS